MSKAAKASEIARAPHRNSQRAGSQNGDVLHFLTRTLQAHLIDGEPHDVLAKLEALQEALDHQELKLADWPDSPSKTRICTALAKAKRLVAQIVADSQRCAIDVTPNVKAS